MRLFTLTVAVISIIKFNADAQEISCDGDAGIAKYLGFLNVYAERVPSLEELEQYVVGRDLNLECYKIGLSEGASAIVSGVAANSQIEAYRNLGEQYENIFQGN